MVPVGGGSFKYWRKRAKPLRPWLIGLRIPGIISELADVIPFIYLCCKLSVVEQPWATQPGDPKAVIVKDGDVGLFLAIYCLVTEAVRWAILGRIVVE